ncbi:DUF2845 domain-containing protein [Pseudomonas schmalbachii]|uniref:DUF2845 domain-containing protein n=1 Tax=Pseudomonas schmalbachii TaxID=2816993 RepID=A0ABS3TQ97_9PSED|nr:DUF2845 domain-containing protein [Pseudomonas schmalbachii]MBO3275844.1 DUF2845 domain-containing protein [Pseudomonas schmalbachii]
MPRILLLSFTIPLSLTLVVSAQAGTMRCGSHLINEGDMAEQVLEKCGNPDAREVLPATPPRRDKDGKIIPGRAEIQIWTYGPRNGAYRDLRFFDGKLGAIGIRRN